MDRDVEGVEDRQSLTRAIDGTARLDQAFPAEGRWVRSVTVIQHEPVNDGIMAVHARQAKASAGVKLEIVGPRLATDVPGRSVAVELEVGNGERRATLEMKQPKRHVDRRPIGHANRGTLPFDAKATRIEEGETSADPVTGASREQQRAASLGESVERRLQRRRVIDNAVTDRAEIGRRQPVGKLGGASSLDRTGGDGPVEALMIELVAHRAEGPPQAGPRYRLTSRQNVRIDATWHGPLRVRSQAWPYQMTKPAATATPRGIRR